MGIGDAIRAIAYAEADTLGSAVALMAKHRNDLDAALRAAELKTMPVSTDGAAMERALLKLEPAPAHAIDELV